MQFFQVSLLVRHPMLFLVIINNSKFIYSYMYITLYTIKNTTNVYKARETSYSSVYTYIQHTHNTKVFLSIIIMGRSSSHFITQAKPNKSNTV